jgi:hypothetical protein
MHKVTIGESQVYINTVIHLQSSVFFTKNQKKFDLTSDNRGTPHKNPFGNANLCFDKNLGNWQYRKSRLYGHFFLTGGFQYWQVEFGEFAYFGEFTYCFAIRLSLSCNNHRNPQSAIRHVAERSARFGNPQSILPFHFSHLFVILLPCLVYSKAD